MDSLQILDHLNSFYSGAFSQLVTYTVALLGFVGVMIPLLVQYIQNRSFRIEKESLETLISNKLEEIRSGLVSMISEQFKNERMKIEESFNKQLEGATANIKSELADAQGGLYHLQGNSRLIARSYSSAVVDYCKASEYYFRSPSEQHLQIVLRNIIKHGLPYLNTEDFTNDQDLRTSLDKMIALLESANQTGRYTLIISDIQQGIAEAKKRPKPA